MIPQWGIEKKRDGQALSAEEIQAFIHGYVVGAIPDYQMAALAMAIYFQGLAPEETVALTQAMLNSGTRMNLNPVPGLKIDKHSTGGIGDKISLALAPLAACHGLIVPMLAGRGLGITGGTLDKLESIAGYRVRLEEHEFIHILKTCGCSIIGQSDTVAPADRKLYALRDVTGTVPSIPLIVSSILSKKVAAGIEGLVLDIKWGRGAFMKTQETAHILAKTLLEVGRALGLRVWGTLTDMNQPLGQAVGNALEVKEIVDVLKGNGPTDVVELTLELTARMLKVGGQTQDMDQTKTRLRAALSNGQALERFLSMVRLQGGNPALIEHPERLPTATIQEPIFATRQAYIAAVDAEAMGKASLELGAGRIRTQDPIDPAVGLADIRKMGESVRDGDVLCVIHANDRERLARARPLAESAFAYSETPPTGSPLITLDLPG